MRTLVRTNDPILMSYIAVLLKGVGIESAELDAGMSATEGSIGILPRRLAVAPSDFVGAAELLREAGLGEWVVTDEQG